MEIGGEGEKEQGRADGWGKTQKRYIRMPYRQSCAREIGGRGENEEDGEGERERKREGEREREG